MRGGRCGGVSSSAPPQKTFDIFNVKIVCLVHFGSFWYVIQGLHQRAVTDGISK